MMLSKQEPANTFMGLRQKNNCAFENVHLLINLLKGVMHTLLIVIIEKSLLTINRLVNYYQLITLVLVQEEAHMNMG